MGKTSLLFQLLEKLRPSARTAFIFQTHCDSRDFLRFLMSDVGYTPAGEHDLVDFHLYLNAMLIEEARRGRRFVLMIDEAQNLSPTVLETIRLLTDFETPSRKLLQIVLSGQPQLEEKLAHRDLAQLRQRISIVTRISPLSNAEVDQYITHRLRAAGYDGAPLFTSGARSLIATGSRGIPREINNLCFNSLSLGCASKRKRIDEPLVKEAIADLELHPGVEANGSRKPAASRLSWKDPVIGIRVAASLALVSLVFLMSFSFVNKSGKPAASPAPVQPAAVLTVVKTADEPAVSVPPEPDPYQMVMVSRKDNLHAIVRRELHRQLNTRLIQEILRLNPDIVNPNLIEEGMQLRLPVSPTTPSAGPGRSTGPVAGGATAKKQGEERIMP
jgi:type II secretory pathway predicted ATPase ExeA